jgi:hypothetical protein
MSSTRMTTMFGRGAVAAGKAGANQQADVAATIASRKSAVLPLPFPAWAGGEGRRGGSVLSYRFMERIRLRTRRLVSSLRKVCENSAQGKARTTETFSVGELLEREIKSGNEIP